jgi:hypothetical protein
MRQAARAFPAHSDPPAPQDFGLETVIGAKSAAALRSRHDCRTPAKKDAALPKFEMVVGFLRVGQAFCVSVKLMSLVRYQKAANQNFCAYLHPSVR